MIRLVLIGSFAAFAVLGSVAVAKDAVAPAATPASVLIEKLAAQGLLTEPTQIHPALSFQTQTSQAASVCTRHCDSQFVSGYEICAATFAKLSSKKEVSDPSLTSRTCGRAALSGLNVCRQSCQTDTAPEAAATN